MKHLLLAALVSTSALAGPPPGTRTVWPEPPSVQDFYALADEDGERYVVALSPARAEHVAATVERLTLERDVACAEADAAESLIAALRQQIALLEREAADDVAVELKIDEFSKAERAFTRSRGSRVSWALGGVVAGLVIGIGASK